MLIIDDNMAVYRLGDTPTMKVEEILEDYYSEKVEPADIEELVGEVRKEFDYEV